MMLKLMPALHVIDLNYNTTQHAFPTTMNLLSIKGALRRPSCEIQLQLIISKSLINVKTLNIGNHTTQNKTQPVRLIARSRT